MTMNSCHRAVTHLRITPPPANREIDGIFEFDTDNLSVLFS